MRLTIAPDGVLCENNSSDEFIVIKDRNDNSVLMFKGNSYSYGSWDETDVMVKLNGVWISVRESLKQIGDLTSKLESLEKKVASICGEVDELNADSEEIKWH